MSSGTASPGSPRWLRGPQRIVCLTGETVDTLYRLGQQQRIVGITGFATNPPQARREKPRVAAYTSARLERIVALQPDLVLAYSDLQAQLAHDLVRAGVEVYVFNQRSVAGILGMIYRLGCLVQATNAARGLIDALQRGLKEATQVVPRQRPRVYFEEWPDPLITGIHWVSELIEIAGGRDVFADRSRGPSALERMLPDTGLVVQAQPDIIIGSWCGRRFRPEQLRQRPQWDTLPALRNGRVHEIKSALILQPGPTALSDGLHQLQRIIHRTAASA